MSSQFLYKLHPTRTAMLIEGPTPDEKASVGRHYAYLLELVDKGVVILAGRTMTADIHTFGIVILNASSQEEAAAIMQADPAVREGVMEASVFPFRIALFSGANASPEETK
jgi:uncharacterized protein YciI